MSNKDDSWEREEYYNQLRLEDERQYVEEGCEMSLYKTFKDFDLYSMELHEIVDIDDKTFRGSILRVPGGWIYERDCPGYSTTSAVFVRFDNEFQKVDNE